VNRYVGAAEQRKIASDSDGNISRHSAENIAMSAQSSKVEIVSLSFNMKGTTWQDAGLVSGKAIQLLHFMNAAFHNFVIVF
jgi:hypothetical protein